MMRGDAMTRTDAGGENRLRIAYAERFQSL